MRCSCKIMDITRVVEQVKTQTEIPEYPGHELSNEHSLSLTYIQSLSSTLVFDCIRFALLRGNPSSSDLKEKGFIEKPIQ